MKQVVALLAAGMTLLALPARAEVTFEYLFDDAYPLAVSDNGLVVAGNSATGGFIPFRWTQATGMVSLGRPQVVGGAGVPGISADGTKVSSGIGSLDESYSTQGLWNEFTGWQELMPPTPPDGGTQDGSYGSAWALSGDGKTVVGLYNRPGVGNRAHASKWTAETGVVDLGGTSTGQASRANAVNHTGSVIGGWVETPQGPWRPAVWAGGEIQLLTTYDPLTTEGIGEVRRTNTTGDIVVGFVRGAGAPNVPRGLGMWKRVNGTFGPTQYLGWVEGTEPSGLNIPYGVSGDGRIVVGYCTFDGTPFSITGFVWTQATGVIDVNTWLADNGVFVDPNFTIQNLSAITPDGTKIFGYGQNLTPPYTRRAFRINVPATVSVEEPRALAGITLAPPRPNPSSSATRLDFTLASAGRVELSIFDAAGRRVATLLDAEVSPGPRSVTWDGRETSGNMASAGLYFARITTPHGSVARRIVRAN